MTADTLPPVVPDAYGNRCTREGWVKEEPCYGEVEVVGEEYGDGVDDGNLDGVPWHDWIYACEGHRADYGHGPYKLYAPEDKP